MGWHVFESFEQAVKKDSGDDKRSGTKKTLKKIVGEAKAK